MSTTAEPSTEHWTGLCAFVEEQMEKTGVPGVAVGIDYQGEVKAAAFGVTNVDHPLPVTDTTLFQIGSITKTFTGTAIMRLVEQGKLDLDATVRTYLPDFRVQDEAASQQVTVRHLLIHTAGWAGDFFLDTGNGDNALDEYVTRMAELEQVSPLGEVWSYNNAAFSLAGRIIERVTEKRFAAALRELVLEPLGMKEAFLEAGDVITHRFVVGHSIDDRHVSVQRPWPLPRAVQPAGGIICHIRDLLRYARFHLDGVTQDKKRLLERAYLVEMQTPQVTVWDKRHWGLSWSINDESGTRILSHGGGTNGQITWLALAPDHDFAISVLTNADRGGQLHGAVHRYALEHYLGLTQPEPTGNDAGAEELAPFVGRYHRPFADLELGLLNGRLVGQIVFKMGFPDKDVVPPPPPPVGLDICEEDQLIVLSGPMKDSVVDVVRKADGSIGWLRAGGRLYAAA